MAPLLSICIPTYNRADLLSDVIESIVKQEVFQISDDVEIVICDNCSTDNTAEVAQNFTEKFPNKVFYYKNEKNIGFDNFERVMSHGNGEFLKLNNDTLIHKENSLKTMLNIIKSNRENKRQIFFLNNSLKTEEENFVCKNLEDFVKNVSYYTTWIGSFGLWKEDFVTIRELFLEKNSTQIPQTYLLFHIITKNKSEIAVNNQELFQSITPKNKGGYNIAEVFGQNYLTILKEFTGTENGLSQKAYEKEKRAIFYFINDFYFDFNHIFAFQKTGYLKFMLPFYGKDFYFYKTYLGILLKQIAPKIFEVKKDEIHKTIKIFGFIRISIRRKRAKKNKDKAE